MAYLLDTHVWIWINMEPDRLSARVRKLLQGEPMAFLLSAVSIVEMTTLVQKGKIQLDIPLDRWINAALTNANAQVVAVSEQIARETCNMNNFAHFDPADRIIAATARTEEAILVTADRTLRQYRQVDTFW